MSRHGRRPFADSTARDVARRVLGRIGAEQAFTALALDAELGRADLPERERKLATELCYGVCRHLSRLDRAVAGAASRGRVRVKPTVRAALRVGAYQLLFLDRVPAHAAVDDAVNAARRAGGAKVAGFVNSLLRRLARDGEPALPGTEQSVEHVQVAHSLPDWIAERLATSLGNGDELLAGAQALNQRPPLGIRCNRTRTDPDALAEILHKEKSGCAITRSEICPDALLTTGLGDPARSPSFERGMWTVQDPGAQLVTRFLTGAAFVSDNRPGDRPAVLDACAGIGGKTLHLCERLGGLIDAADVSQAKLSRLIEAAERLGLAERVRTVVVDLTRPLYAGDSSDDTERVDDGPGLTADRVYDLVLLDAPCTGLGVMRRHPEVKWRVCAADVDRIADTQRALLDRVSQHVRPGGVLVYCVCTFTYEEGPGQVRSFLARHPDFHLHPPPAPSSADGPTPEPPWSALACSLTAGAPPSPGTLATWPHRHGADAFFAARLRRRLPGE